MLKKVLRLRNVGKFAGCTPRGDVEFRGLTLVFGENGRGKTTFCGVLRSLATGDPSYVTERQRLGTNEKPEIGMLMESGAIKFTAGSWDTTCLGMHIFDSTFVYENVYAGEHVGHEHKKNLHRVIVGKEAIGLNEQIVKLDAESRGYAKQLRGLKAEIQVAIPDGVAFDAFLALEGSQTAKEDLAIAEGEIAALRSADDIQQTPLLKQLDFPTFPAGFEALLKRTLEDVSANAEEQLQKHLAEATNDASERWLQAGVEYVLADNCPFCGQGLAGSELLPLFRSYFSKEYAALKREIADFGQTIEDALSEVKVASLYSTADRHSQATAFWKQFVQTGGVLSNSQEIDWRGPIDALRRLAADYARRKADSPLEAVTLGIDFEQAVKEFEALRSSAEEYNQGVASVNVAIGKRKQETSGGSLAAKQKEIAQIRAVIARHTEATTAKCVEYEATVALKKAADEKKAEARANLDKHSSDVFTRYSDRINDLLHEFRAAFQLADLRAQHTGGQPSSSYAIVIRNERVPVGDPNEPRGKPRFGCTLSAGDKSTLALAFFWHSLSKTLAMQTRLSSSMTRLQVKTDSGDNERNNLSAIPTSGAVKSSCSHTIRISSGLSTTATRVQQSRRSR